MEQQESTQGVILLPQRLSRITGDISGIGRGLLRYTEFGRRSDNCIVIAELYGNRREASKIARNPATTVIRAGPSRESRLATKELLTGQTRF